MRKLLLAACAALLLAACAGPGTLVLIPGTMPGGEKFTIGAHDQWAPDFLLDRNRLALNFIFKGDATEKQLAAVAETERACRIYTKTVRPNNLVAVVSNGAVYALAGYIGVGVGSKAFPGTNSSEYGRYGGWANGVAGLANGVISIGGQTYTFESCGRDVLDMFPTYAMRVINKSPY